MRSRPHTKQEPSFWNHVDQNMNLIVIGILVILAAFIYSYEETNNYDLKNVTAVLMSSGSPKDMLQTIKQFYSTKNPRQELAKVIIIYDGLENQQLRTVYQYVQDTYYNNPSNLEDDSQKIVFLCTGKNNGQLMAIDFAYSKVQTQFVFLLIGDWKFIETGYLEKAITLLNKNKDLSQVIIGNLIDSLSEPGTVPLLQTLYAGFSLKPSVHRFSIYQQISGGYTSLTDNLTLQMGVGQAQSIISMYYVQSGYNISTLDQIYVQKRDSNDTAYIPYQFNKGYLFRKFQKTKKEQSLVCSATLEYTNFQQQNYFLKRLKKKQLNQIISLPNTTIDLNLEQFGLGTSIQVGSQFDYLFIQKQSKFQQITKQYPKSLYWQHIFYYQKKELQPAPVIINATNFKNLSQINKYLVQLKVQNLANLANTAQIQTKKLALKLLQSQNDKKALEAEYFYYANKFGLDKITKQLRMCIFVEGYNLFSRADMRRLLKSIEKQNYTNYKVVYSVDENKDYSASKFKQVAKALKSRIFNRLGKIIKNQDRLGTDGNHFLRVKQLCGGTDVIVALQGNSSLIGKQAFNIINAAFQKDDTWMAFFNTVKYEEGVYAVTNPIETRLKFREKRIETDHYLAAYRFELIKKLPIEYVMEFIRDEETGFLKPTFYQSQTNAFHLYAYSELSGPNRIQNLNAPIYFYNKLDTIFAQGCWFQKQQWTKTKAFLKYQLKPLDTLNSTIQVDLSPLAPIQSLAKVKNTFQQYFKCVNQSKKVQIQSIVYQEASFNQYLNKSLSNMQVANYFISTFQVSKIHHMPFCLVIWGNDEKGKQNSQNILQSVVSSGYKNYTALVITDVGSDSKTQIKSQKTPQEWVSIYNVTILSHSYFSYKSIIKSTCTQNALIMFLNNPLQKNALSQLNKLHQEENSWMTYSVNQEYVQINTLYFRIYDLIQQNDFEQTNTIYLENGDQQVQVLAILQMCKTSSTNYNQSKIYKSLKKVSNQDIEWLRAFKSNSKIYKRNSYQYLQTLSQDKKENLTILEEKLANFYSGKTHLSRPITKSYLSKIDLLQAYEYEQLPYLPDNHMLSTREYQYLDKKYEINKYMSGQYENKTTRFCFTIFGRNNTQDYRYKKNLKSVIMQNYTNYHIVYMDDVSDDDTLERAMNYLRQSGFPKERVTFVRNIQRTYATYNIINSCFNFCKEDEVQVRMDGDDPLIGRNIFGMLNAVYLKNPQYWVVYTSFKSSDFTFGTAYRPANIEQALNCRGGRLRTHFITPITTWKVKVVRSIPLKYHLDQFGIWLTTLYDDALQYPFLQLATLDRIHYIPYLPYNYNIAYGSNDNSNPQKVKDRTSLFKHVITMESLAPLKSLNDPRTNNTEVYDAFKKDWGIKYDVVNY